jgi:hypothetical protein
MGTAVVDTVKQRKPDFASVKSSPSGCVSRDDRGNAVWQWGRGREEMHGNVNHLGLTVGDDSQPPDTNSQPLKSVGNPYNSGPVEHTRRGARQDLRALSRQIEQQRKRAKDEGS